MRSRVVVVRGWCCCLRCRCARGCSRGVVVGVVVGVVTNNTIACNSFSFVHDLAFILSMISLGYHITQSIMHLQRVVGALAAWSL